MKSQEWQWWVGEINVTKKEFYKVGKMERDWATGKPNEGKPQVNYIG